jgi:hypothetical protein
VTSHLNGSISCRARLDWMQACQWYAQQASGPVTQGCL